MIADPNLDIFHDLHKGESIIHDFTDLEFNNDSTFNQSCDDASSLKVQKSARIQSMQRSSESKIPLDMT